MALTLIGDVHLGLRRQRGVTRESLARFAGVQIATLKRAIESYDSIVILGDLFDTFSVDYGLLIQLLDFLPKEKQVTVLRGNHDVSKDSEKLGAVDFLGVVSRGFKVISEPEILYGAAFIPHVQNQGLFDEYVSWAAEESDVLITHANFDNHFATERDHSLNLSSEQADMFKLVISGHEHVARDIGHVHMIGSLTPTRVSEAGHIPGVAVLTDEDKFTREEFPALSYREVDIGFCKPIPLCDFIKIAGCAKAPDLAGIARRVEEIFLESGAMMFQNAVEIEGMTVGEVAAAAGNVEKFDPVKLLLELLPEAAASRLRGLGLC